MVFFFKTWFFVLLFFFAEVRLKLLHSMQRLFYCDDDVKVFQTS